LNALPERLMMRMRLKLQTVRVEEKSARNKRAKAMKSVQMAMGKVTDRLRNSASEKQNR
jgi:hypothetical protein